MVVWLTRGASAMGPFCVVQPSCARCRRIGAAAPIRPEASAISRPGLRTAGKVRTAPGERAARRTTWGCAIDLAATGLAAGPIATGEIAASRTTPG